MSKDQKAYLYHMIEAIGNIESYVDGLSEQDFYESKIVQDAVIRNLEIIGEAAKQVSKAIKDKHPGIEWKQIAGLRDILIHEYFGVDIEKVWRIVQNRLLELKKKLIKIVSI